MNVVALPSARRALIPREHGAYAQLSLPLVTALLGGSPGPTAAALCVAPIAAFMAHEPMLVLLGHRGPRALREDRARASLWLTASAGVAATTGSFGLISLGAERAWSALPAFGAAVLLAPFIASRKEKTAWGEVIAAIAMASAALPASIASGISPTLAIAAIFAWSLGAIVATCGVRTVIAAQRNATSLPGRIAVPAMVSALGAIAVAPGWLPWWSFAAAAPSMVLALGLATKPPHPRHLKTVGWTLAGASMVTLVLLVVALRLGH